MVREVLGKTYARLDVINRTDNEEAMTVLMSNGLELFDVEQDSLELWRATAQSTNARIWAETASDKSLYQRMNDLLAEYRTSQQSAAVNAGS